MSESDEFGPSTIHGAMATTGGHPRESTDVHQTKISPDDPRLRLERARSRTLRKGPALAAMLAIALVGTLALVVALASPDADAPEEKPVPGAELAASPVKLPDVIRDPPAPSTAAAESLPPPARELPLTPAADGAPHQGERGADDPTPEEIAKARASAMFPAFDEITSAAPLAEPRTPRIEPPASSAPPPGPDPARTADPNLQERKNDFLAKAGTRSADYLEKALSLPRSPFELKAGTVIPAVLLTGLSSDLPGVVVAQAREHVYDTVSGNHLLVPQGSRLIAAYDSMVAWGQSRVLVCWNRLIRPDGSSIGLDCMPGVDLAGYAGFSDEVDNHWWKIVSGAALASLLAATAQRSQGDVTGFSPSFPQMWAMGAAGQVNQAGQQLAQKNLQIQPTITVRPGLSVNVLVSKDIVLSPYPQEGARP